MQIFREYVRTNATPLTGPVILSSSNEYGVTNMGIEGMTMFFIHHKCNSYCQLLPRPVIADFVKKIPEEMLASCNRALHEVGGMISYLHELTTPIRAVVAQTMREVAAKCYR